MVCQTHGGRKVTVDLHYLRSVLGVLCAILQRAEDEALAMYDAEIANGARRLRLALESSRSAFRKEKGEMPEQRMVDAALMVIREGKSQGDFILITESDDTRIVSPFARGWDG